MMYDSDEEIEVGTNGEWIVENLVPGDNVASPSGTTDPFWIFLVDKGPLLLNQTFEMDGGIGGHKVIMSYGALNMMCYKVVVGHTF
jgi:hypothetical protein